MQGRFVSGGGNNTPTGDLAAVKDEEEDDDDEDDDEDEDYDQSLDLGGSANQARTMNKLALANSRTGQSR